MARLSDAVRETLEHGRRVGEIGRTPPAAVLWERIYPALSEDKAGLLGKLLARSEAHVTRLAALYALVHVRTVWTSST